MIGLAFLILATTPDALGEAAKALAAGREIQAGMMIDAARAAGAGGEPVDRLAADRALTSGENARALAMYQALLLAHPDEALLLERAGEAALRIDDNGRATALLDRATLQPDASWHAWNLRGIAADRRGAFDEADAAYTHAATLAPGKAAIANNHGWSLMLRGRWSEAAEALQVALTLDPAVAHGAANLELARTALSADLPAREAGESDSDFAARLNDAGVVAAAGGDRARAIAAFTNALSTRSVWFERAAHNLALVEQRGP